MSNLNNETILKHLQQLGYEHIVKFKDDTFGKYGVKFTNTVNGKEHNNFCSFACLEHILVGVMRCTFTNLKNKHRARFMYLNNLFSINVGPTGSLFIEGDTLWMQFSLPVTSNVPSDIISAFIQQAVDDANTYLQDYYYPNLDKILE